MKSFAMLSIQAGLLLSTLLILPINALPQGDDIDPCLDNEATTLDGATSDKSAGIGVEFETSAIWFSSPKCSASDTNQAKGKVVGNRKGTNWELTADTTNDIAGTLVAEYILDGTQIKIGDGTATAAAAAVSDDIMGWNPSADMDNNEWNIDGNNCNPWKVTKPGKGGSQNSFVWQTQVTAPLPFEAIGDLFAAALSQPVTSPLLPGIRPGSNVVSVTKDFFQSKPNGISSDSVKADVLGFLSLVVSYVKKATVNDPPQYSDESPKNKISIMPRTEFVTLYAQVKGTLPGSDSLYNLVKVLACYKNDEDGVEIDSLFCDGTVEAPKPNPYMDGIGWCLKDSSNGDQDCLLVKDWIASIENGPSPDKLTTLDKLIDGQVGGLNTALENVVGTTRAVPLFEFRNLIGIKGPDMSSKVDKAEQEIIKYHKKYKSAPEQGKRKRNYGSVFGKRQANPGCTITAAPAPAPTPTCSLQNQDPGAGIYSQGCVCDSTTLPLLTVDHVTDDAQSCAYTAMPTSNVANPITIDTQTYTRNCQACTLVGGIADYPTCTPVAGCTPTPTTPPPSPNPPAPVCSAGFYGTDTSCGNKCNGPNAKCACGPAGFPMPQEACSCSC